MAHAPETMRLVSTPGLRTPPLAAFDRDGVVPERRDRRTPWRGEGARRFPARIAGWLDVIERDERKLVAVERRESLRRRALDDPTYNARRVRYDTLHARWRSCAPTRASRRWC